MKLKKGFSLIEIGIVMIVIGILIAAVMKGKDVIKSAEIKQHNQTYLNKWVSVATTHYDKVGYNIGGSATSGAIGTVDGSKDDNTTGDGAIVGCNNLITYAEKAGINLNNVILTNTDNPCQKTISGEYSGDVTVSVVLKNMTITTSEENASTRNMVLFKNMPGDVALAFDRLVDGQADTYAGKVVVLEAYTSAQADANMTVNDYNTTITALSDINATDLHTVGVILEH